jgi:hypothetical protein
MCAPRYAATCTSIATQGARTFAECVTFAREVRELLFAQWVRRIGRLSCFFAPRAECLICLCFSAARPPRTSRPFILPSLGGGLGPAVPALSFAKLRSDTKTSEAPRQRFPCRPTAAAMTTLARPHVGHVRQIDPSQDAGAPTVLRCPSLNCDLTKLGDEPRQQFACRLIAAGMPTLWLARTCVMFTRSTEPGRRSCGGCVHCLQIERRKATSRRLSVGRGNVR